MNPGVYQGMGETEYRSHTDWLSSSQLKTHLPEHYKPFTGTTDALEFGVAAHTVILGVGDPVQPVTASNWRTKDAQEKRVAARDAGLVPVLDADMDRLNAMAEAVEEHPEAGPLLAAAGRSELSVFADVDGVPCKCRFDRLTGDGVAVDLKTTSAKPGAGSLARAVLDFGYDISADHYLRVASAAGLDAHTFVHVWVGKEPPHHVTVTELDASFYERAAVLRDLALERLQHPEMVEPYPGASGRLVVELPRWARL